MARNDLTPFGVGGFEPLYSLHREMNRLFDDMMRGGGSLAPRGAEGGAMAVVNAQMNVSEDDEALRISVELPGVAPNDVDISLNDDVLTIRGEKRFEAERGQGKSNYHYVERSYGSFQRSLRLPFNVRPEEVQADFENGVLTVTVPKAAQQARSHRIQIGGARSAGSPAMTANAETASEIPPTESSTPSSSGDGAPARH